MIPSLFPLYDHSSGNLKDGNVVKASGFCKRSILTKAECKRHYQSLSDKGEGYYQCPFGFTSRSFFFDGHLHIVTGVVAFPRFDTANERQMAKAHPDTKVARKDIDDYRLLFQKLDVLRADIVKTSAQIFPQAFHELRKLNGAILQHAEKELKTNGSTPGLQTIKSAAELMRNNFDILEALSNIEGMRALPSSATINVFDLVYKTKRVFTERAKDRGIVLNLTGVRAIIRGSEKSFPIVPAVLIENAIKYGKRNRSVTMTVSSVEKSVVQFVVENETDYPIDTERCFERGSRYAGNAAEGGGYGLFLASEIVRAHHGTIQCASNRGCIKMIVKLPLEKIIP